MKLYPAPKVFKIQFWTQEVESLINHYEDFLVFIIKQAIKRPITLLIQNGFTYDDFRRSILLITQSIKSYFEVDLNDKILKIHFYYCIIDRYNLIATDENEGYREIPLVLDKILMIEAIFRFLNDIQLDLEALRLSLNLLITKRSKKRLSNNRQLAFLHTTSIPIVNIKDINLSQKLELMIWVLYHRYDEALLNGIEFPY